MIHPLGRSRRGEGLVAARMSREDSHSRRGQERPGRVCVSHRKGLMDRGRGPELRSRIVSSWTAWDKAFVFCSRSHTPIQCPLLDFDIASSVILSQRSISCLIFTRIRHSQYLGGQELLSLNMTRFRSTGLCNSTGNKLETCVPLPST